MWGIQEQWERSTESALVPVVSVDPDSRIRFTNKTFERRFGSSPASVVGQSLWTVLEPGESAGDPIANVRAGGSHLFRARAKDQEGGRRDVWVVCVPHRTADGEVLGCGVVLTDFHDRDESGRGTDSGHLRAFLLATPDGVVAFDERGVVQSANAAAERMFRYPAGGLVGRSVRVLVPAADGRPDPWIVGGDRAAEGTRRDGSRFPVAVSVAAAEGSYAGVVRDATGVRELEQRVVTAADAVRRSVGEDLHDNVCQQLTGLGLMVDTLAQLVAGSNPAATLVANVAEALRQVNADIRQLATGLIPPNVPADGLVAALERLVTQIRDHSGCRCEFVATDPVRLADAATATHLFRIAQEAVCNAVRHSHASAIRVGVRFDLDAVEVEVRDDGGGHSPRPDGVGLGTRLMRDRAARIGGTLAIDATGGGTVVTVRVPSRPSDAGTPR